VTLLLKSRVTGRARPLRSFHKLLGRCCDLRARRLLLSRCASQQFWRPMSQLGQNAKASQRAFLDRCTPESGRSFERRERQLRADFVEKVVDDLWEQ